MNDFPQANPLELKQGATVAVLGGGPAGAFFAIHLLRKANKLARNIKVIIFERRRQAADSALDSSCATCWKGCNHCAGGISPKLNDILNELGLKIPPEIIQDHLRSFTIQGFWKNIELEVPEGREMLSVYRGSRPVARVDRASSFDSFLLEEALKAGAQVISGAVHDVQYAPNGKPIIHYGLPDEELRLEVDLAVFAAGVNEQVGLPAASSPLIQALHRLLPDFVPPRLRKALIFELKATPKVPEHLAGVVHFINYGSRDLHLEMCSLVPKRGYLTVVLVGASIDAAAEGQETQAIMRLFLELPHIRKLISPSIRLHTACVCRPNMVVGSARAPYGHRIAAVGDIVTARLYKDGILSAHQTAKALADTVLRRGIDAESLRRGYEPTLRRFRRNNRFASMVFLLNRLFFGSSVLSRVLYQAVITERKTTPSAQRHLEKILWRIASGDEEYEDIFLTMVHPATVGSILTGGMLITLRNYLTELVFGLRWEGFGRFTTGVALERLEEKRRQFSWLMASASVQAPEQLEFERMYTIKIHAPRQTILEQLGRFGEADRGYFRPRWLRVRRIEGEPNLPGCVIRYEILSRHLCFNLILEQVVGGHLAAYRVQDGYARGGVLIFEIEKIGNDICALSIYVAFDFVRGRTWKTRPLWWLFRRLFPAYVHDVLWNHSLCQLKDIVEANHDAGQE